MSNESNELGARQPPQTDRSEAPSRIVSVGASQLEGASDVLLLGPMQRSLDDQVCAACLEAASEVGSGFRWEPIGESGNGAAVDTGEGSDGGTGAGSGGGSGPVAGAGRNVLLVSLVQRADDRLAVVRNRFGRLPEHVGVVSCTDRFGSTTSTGSTASTGSTDLTASTASTGSTGSTPSNASSPGDVEGETSISVDVVEDPSDLPKLGIAITRMAEGLRTGSGIVVCVHSVTALLQYAEPQRVFRFIHVLQNQLEGVRHYHMDVDAHDRQTIATLRPLFDRVVEFDADGTVTVTK